MPQQTSTRIEAEKAQLNSRSLLLKPIVDGRTPGRDDVSSFLGQRLASKGRGSAAGPNRRLS